MSCGFTKTDLTNIVHILEVCTKRGAFQAEELTGVGQLYDRLKKACNNCPGLEQNTPSSQEQEPVKNCEDGDVCELNCDGGVCQKETSVCDGGACPINIDNIGNCGR